MVPRHTGVAGNETADALAKARRRALPDPSAGPTFGWLRSEIRKKLRGIRRIEWAKTVTKLSERHRKWHLNYLVTCPKELETLTRS